MKNVVDTLRKEIRADGLLKPIREAEEKLSVAVKQAGNYEHELQKLEVELIALEKEELSALSAGGDPAAVADKKRIVSFGIQDRRKWVDILRNKQIVDLERHIAEQKTLYAEKLRNEIITLRSKVDIEVAALFERLLDTCDEWRNGVKAYYQEAAPGNDFGTESVTVKLPIRLRDRLSSLVTYQQEEVIIK